MFSERAGPDGGDKRFGRQNAGPSQDGGGGGGASGGHETAPEPIDQGRHRAAANSIPGTSIRNILYKSICSILRRFTDTVPVGGSASEGGPAWMRLP